MALVITGMHRSGTSLCAGWLQACGLKLGKRLFPATYGNPKGHFEDLDFVEFQQGILDRHGVRFALDADRTLSWSNSEGERAQELIEERRAGEGSGSWGWKDPRTSLFLENWRELVPDMQVLGLFRPCEQVVDSLLRRDRRQSANKIKQALVPFWHSRANKVLVQRYRTTWRRYNSGLMDFAERHPGQILLVEVEDLVTADRALFDALTERGFGLRYKALAKVMKKGMLKTVESEASPDKRCQQMYTRLQELAWKPGTV